MINWKNVRVVWNNGYWKLFDFYRYQDVQIFDSLADLKDWSKNRGAGAWANN